MIIHNYSRVHSRDISVICTAFG